MTAANMTTNITVRDLTDARILRAVIAKAGRDLYDEAVAEHGAATVNVNLYSKAMRIKHPGITMAEIEDSLAKASVNEVLDMVDFANGYTYNHLMVISLPNDNGVGRTPMALLSQDEGLTTDPVDHISAIVEAIGSNIVQDADLDKQPIILDLPVVVFKQIGDTLKPVPIKANITQLAEEIQRKQR